MALFHGMLRSLLKKFADFYQNNVYEHKILCENQQTSVTVFS